MSKLIFDTTQCGYRRKPLVGNNCICAGGERISCHYIEFPVSCPLPNGLHANPATTEELIQIAKTSGLLYEVTKPISLGLQTITLLKTSLPGEYRNDLPGGKLQNIVSTDSKDLSDGSGLAQLRHDAETLHTIPLIPKNSKDTTNKMIKRLKRRNRKDCISFISGSMSKNRCTHQHYQISGSMVYPICKGVNCGTFQPKTK